MDTSWSFVDRSKETTILCLLESHERNHPLAAIMETHTMDDDLCDSP